MPGVLTVVSQKGGVGKTTTAVNLAAALAHRGIKTLLVDVDPQGAVRHALGLREAPPAGLADFLLGGLQLSEVIQATGNPWLRVLTAGSIAERGDHADYLLAVGRSERLAELTERAVARGHLVIIDTPPGLGPVSRAVLGVSDLVLVPLQCEPLALQTSGQLLRGIADASKERPGLAVAGILLTMFEPGNPTSERVAQVVREQLPSELVYDVVIPRSAAAVDAVAAGQPLVLRSPEDPAAQAYRALADVVETQLP